MPRMSTLVPLPILALIAATILAAVVSGHRYAPKPTLDPPSKFEPVPAEHWGRAWRKPARLGAEKVAKRASDYRDDRRGDKAPAGL